MRQVYTRITPLEDWHDQCGDRYSPSEANITISNDILFPQKRIKLEINDMVFVLLKSDIIEAVQKATNYGE